MHWNYKQYGTDNEQRNYNEQGRTMRDQENEVCDGDETETKRYKAT
jgi:hypothetical protein